MRRREFVKTSALIGAATVLGVNATAATRRPMQLSLCTPVDAAHLFVVGQTYTIHGGCQVAPATYYSVLITSRGEDFGEPLFRSASFRGECFGGHEYQRGERLYSDAPGPFVVLSMYPEYDALGRQTQMKAILPERTA